MGHELLFKVGDDPLYELAEMDHFYHWSDRIARLRSLYERKSRTNTYLVIALMISLIAAACLIGAVAYLHFF
ncbi:MAG: hypothetical protein JW939_09530 [Candidatus Thermoplasmatota archaeon]|nr:hypothetical protein [Candidatus Thermoplasmatota archaeon]